MFNSNPFGELSAVVSSPVQQWFVIVMILFVVGGTLFDVVHKGSAKYFFRQMQKSKTTGDRSVGGGEAIGIAVKTAAIDVATSAEFCNPHRRIAHLMTMYGFILNVVMTLVLVFCYGTTVDAPSIYTALWYLGALSVCIGGYWFWFFIRVDVASEGGSPFRLERADLFVLSLLGSMTFAIIWGLTGGMIWLGLYLIATVLLFGGVPWSKFAHMFFKPAAAYEKRMSYASGAAQNLPTISRDDPEQQKRHSMELLVDAPMDMGLGIKREKPTHF